MFTFVNVVMATLFSIVVSSCFGAVFLTLSYMADGKNDVPTLLELPLFALGIILNYYLVVTVLSVFTLFPLHLFLKRTSQGITVLISVLFCATVVGGIACISEVRDNDAWTFDDTVGILASASGAALFGFWFGIGYHYLETNYYIE